MFVTHLVILPESVSCVRLLPAEMTEFAIIRSANLTQGGMLRLIMESEPEIKL